GGKVSLAGGFPSTKLDPARLTHWSGVACAPAVPEVAAAAPPADCVTAAGDFVRKLERSVSRGTASGPPPGLVLRPGGNFLLGFLRSDERWFAPGKAGTESLSAVGPWPVVRREEEAIYLRRCVASFIREIEAVSSRPARLQLATKADLLRALLLVL